uniref:Putative ABC transport system permease protein n=1 Tax=Candidatus Kentrum sp. FW TaxID=2126338 RepID=A0A450SUC1_9GAMM|nr:MAG: putative ABC transport system permease protein [Candidatus Kentron sp. FW]
MFAYKIYLLLAEGAVFGLVAVGIFIAFRWVRFPDLTPDGSFALGACACVLVTHASRFYPLGVFAAVLAGAGGGICTAAINRWIGVPSVVAGLLIASALYSVNWLLLDSPNLPLNIELMPFAAQSGVERAAPLALWLVGTVVLLILFFSWFANTTLGLTLRALGENPLLARPLGFTETRATFIGLALANGLVGLAGGLFVLRLYAADINMGIGITITGLAGMVLGLLIVGSAFRPWQLLTSVVVGAMIYKLLLFAALELGMPAQSFRLVSAIILAVAFLGIRHVSKDILGGLRWT